METTKKPYQAPKLIVHGNVEEITGMPKTGLGSDGQQFPPLS